MSFAPNIRFCQHSGCKERIGLNSQYCDEHLSSRATQRLCTYATCIGPGVRVQQVLDDELNVKTELWACEVCCEVIEKANEVLRSEYIHPTCRQTVRLNTGRKKTTKTYTVGRRHYT